jgi:membrane protein
MPPPAPSIQNRFSLKVVLGGLTPSQLARNVLRDLGSNNILGRSSELAFEFLFALLPLLFFMLNLFGTFASRSSELQNDLLAYFSDFLPAAAFQLLKSTLAELAANATSGKLTVGILVALWFAAGGVNSMIASLNSAYRVQETRSWFKVRGIAVLLTLLISVLLFSAAFLLLVSSDFLDWLGAELRIGANAIFIWRTVQWPAAIVFIIVSYSLIYYFGPDLKERRWHWITPGSACGACLWLLASAAFRVYLRFFNTYGASYGSLGAVMILLVWLYVTGFAFLIGGEINAEIERAAARRAQGMVVYD